MASSKSDGDKNEKKREIGLKKSTGVTKKVSLYIR